MAYYITNFGVDSCKCWENWFKKDINTGQLNFLQPKLENQMTKKHPLVKLAYEINWKYFEKEFEPLYRSDDERTAVKI